MVDDAFVHGQFYLRRAKPRRYHGGGDGGDNGRANRQVAWRGAHGRGSGEIYTVRIDDIELDFSRLRCIDIGTASAKMVKTCLTFEAVANADPRTLLSVHLLFRPDKIIAVLGDTWWPKEGETGRG